MGADLIVGRIYSEGGGFGLPFLWISIATERNFVLSVKYDQDNQRRRVAENENRFRRGVS